MTKNDIAWEKLFNHFDIISEVDRNGIFKITSTQINKIGQREARLMTKFDHRNNLPNLFQENKLSILPDSRGSYLIGRFKTHHTIKYDEIKKPLKKPFPSEIESISPNEITSEAVALNIAYASGMIDEVIETESNENSYLTLSGRLGSRQLQFKINSIYKDKEPYSITVKNSQIEIDASYENTKNIGVIEAKNKTPHDFLVRQLYYPYLFYKNLNLSKKIIPIFFTYAENIFSFHVYRFNEVNNYSSIERVKQVDYILDTNVNITLSEIQQLMNLSTFGQLGEDLDVPFPQANNFLRILDLLNLLAEGPKTRREIALNYGFDERQADYYYNALRYLGYAEKRYRGGPAEITDKGKYIFQRKDTKQGKLEIIKDITASKVFAECLQQTLQQGKIISQEDVSEIIGKYRGDLNINRTTKNRRASTVREWINWILNIATEDEII